MRGSLIAVLNGSSLDPRVEVPVTGIPHIMNDAFRAWVSALPERTWSPDAKTWTIFGFGPGSDPDAELDRFGFTTIGPDDEPTQLATLVRPIALAAPNDPGFAYVYPRLTGRDAVAGHVGPDAPWSVERRCFMARTVVFQPGTTGWCLTDPSLLQAAAAAPYTAHVSTEAVARTPMLYEVPPALIPDSPVPAVAVALPTATPLPLLEYDGTVDGLRGVPLVDLNSVRSTGAASMLGLGIHNIYDLLHHVPRDYIDMSNPLPLADATVGTDVAILGTAVKVSSFNGMTKATIRDINGDQLYPRWFNAPWIDQKLKVGSLVLCHGRLGQFTTDSGFTGYQMTNPLLDAVTIDQKKGLIGIYPASGKHEVTTWMLHHACAEAARRIGNLADPIPEALLKLRGMPCRADAFRMVHDPASRAEGDAGHERLAYDELLRLQLALMIARAAQQAEPAVVHAPTGHLTDQLLAALPFKPTGAQTRATAEILADMSSPQAMNRLLQGDVGSGKTLVSLLAMLAAQESGFQAALIAPTEILAAQHYFEIVKLLNLISDVDGNKVEAVLLTNKVTGKDRKKVIEDLGSGKAGIVVGTQAVFAAKVEFAALGLVIIDEQHRFGAEQRGVMLAKGAPRPDGTRALPDILFATATPIPRTAMMTVFGDLDVSILDEKPAGRTPTKTTHVEADDAKVDDVASPVWDAVLSEVAVGRQAFVLCPLRDSELGNAAAAGLTAERLAATSLNGLRIEVVTGKQKADERREVMARFERGEVDVLVATTVIEVGVNVPNATVMVILDADRFGLAQLHQLRGRVGRGQYPGTCFLVASPKTSDGEERIAALVASDDGFELAEKDLQIRGAGQILGKMQAGTTRDLRVANILKDTTLLTWAKEDAGRIIAEDPKLSRRPQLRAEIDAALGEEAAAWLTSA